MNFRLLLFYFIVGLFISGCARNNIEIKTNQSELTKDKEWAYVVFSRPNSLASSYSIDIFNVKKEKIIEAVPIVSLDAKEKNVYKTTSGKKLFMANVWNNYNFFEFELKKGQIKYVSMFPRPGILVEPVEEHRILLAKNIESSLCNNTLINNFLFKEVPIDNDNTNSFILEKTPNYNLSKYKSDSLFEIICEKNKIKEIKDLKIGTSFSKLENVKLVSPNKESIQSLEKDVIDMRIKLAKEYMLWSTRFKGVNFSENVFLDLKNRLDIKYYKKFDSIKIIDNTDIAKNEIKKEFSQKIKSSISDYNKKKNTNLIVKYKILIYDSGSMMERYTTLLLDKETIGSIKVAFDYFLEDGTKINSIELSVIESGGVLGGINTLVRDTISKFNEYTVANFMEEKK